MRGRQREEGFAVSSEVLLIAVILVCGLITGWVKLRDQSLAEVKDTMAAIDQWVAGSASALQPYAQPWISAAGVVTSTAVAPVTDEYTGPPCVATSGGPVVCPPAGPSLAGGTLTLTYGPNPTAATAGNPASFEANTTF